MKRKPVKRTNPFLWVAVVLIAGIAAYSMIARSPQATTAAALPSLPPAALESVAPNFTLSTLEGKVSSLQDYRGKVVILDFWASWCAPCKREIPDFVDLQKTYGSRGLQVIGVALDEESPVREYAAMAGINYPVLMGTQQVANLYGGISGIPTTFVIDAAGNIVEKYEGFRPRAVFENQVRKLLALREEKTNNGLRILKRTRSPI